MSASTQDPLAFTSERYGDAYSRINGLVIVGEGLADRHFRHLAELIPSDRHALHRLGAMEGRPGIHWMGRRGRASAADAPDGAGTSHQ